MWRESMSESMSRRNLLKSIALAASTAATAQALVSTASAQAAKPATAQAAKPAAPPAAKPKLDPKDKAAIALGYHDDASKVDAKKFPMFKPKQLCNNCLQIQGKAGEAWRGCNLFPKNLVAEKGWCKVWVKKPGTA
jgi:secreted PhoX family phosphatase